MKTFFQGTTAIIGLFFCQSFVLPSQIWNLSTDMQSFFNPHIGINEYFSVSNPVLALSYFPLQKLELKSEWIFET